MKSLAFSPRASADLEKIGDYIAQDNPRRAASFIDELETRCRQIAATPTLFPVREDLAPNLRLAVHGNYLIFSEACTIRCESSASSTARETSPTLSRKISPHIEPTTNGKQSRVIAVLDNPVGLKLRVPD